MSSPPPKPPSPLAASWLRRLHVLQNLREQYADGPVPFRWLIQIRILRFLLDRYGSDTALVEPTPTQAPDKPFITALPTTPNPPRSPYVMHYYLDRIVQSNAPLHPARQEKIAQERFLPANRLEKIIAYLNKPLFQKAPINEEMRNKEELPDGGTPCSSVDH